MTASGSPQSGVVVSFDAERGFGFLRPDSGGGDDVFVHISDLPGRRPLAPGQGVRFAVVMAERGPRAVDVDVLVGRTDPLRLGPDRARDAVALALTALFAAVLHVLTHLSWLVSGLIAVNLLTFIAYAWDKCQGNRGGRRLPEAVLLGLALIGGSPAALAAMLGLRHKTAKRSFLVWFAAVVVIQGLGLMFLKWMN